MNKEVDQEVSKMWRAFFLAIGISLIIVGAECMVVHKAVLAGERSAATDGSTPEVSTGSQEFKPPEWALMNRKADSGKTKFAAAARSGNATNRSFGRDFPSS